MAKPANAPASRNNPNEQFKIALSHDIKEVIIKVIDLIIAFKAPVHATTK